MKTRIYSILLTLFIPFSSFAQTDYKTSTKNKDGFTCIYTVTYTKPTTLYGSGSSEYKYGLLEEKTQKIVLPIKYKSVYTSYEDGLYIVQDESEKDGLYNAKTQAYLVVPTYNKIETFTDGIGIVQKKAFVNGWNEYTYGAIDKTGKLIAYLITDFIKAAGNSINSVKHKK